MTKQKSIVPFNLKERAKAANSKLAKYLKSLRKEKNYTMRPLSEIIGKPHSFVGKMEMSDRRLDVGEFIHYCKALDKDPREAFGELMDLVDGDE